MNSGETVDIAPSDAGSLRWLTFSGERGELHPRPNGTWTSTYGWTNRPDSKTTSFSDCASHEIHFGNQTGKRIEFDVIETTFESGGVKLAGRLVLPKGKERIPVVVLVHGSEHDSALQTYSMQRTFPAQGIGVFVYDKRGTGSSGGTYTQDFATLADDAIAALKSARRLAGSRVARIGFQDASQGGSVVPLAAQRVPVDFAVISFRLSVTILEDDQESVALDMHIHHHSSEDTAKALKLARGGERVAASGGKEGYQEFDALRNEYRSVSWYKDVHGDLIGLILPLNQQQITDLVARELAPAPFQYPPMPVLRASTTPQLWILGAGDLQAPSAETAKRIKSLITSGTLDLLVSLSKMLCPRCIKAAFNNISQACWKCSSTDLIRPSSSGELNALRPSRNEVKAFAFNMRASRLSVRGREGIRDESGIYHKQHSRLTLGTHTAVVAVFNATTAEIAVLSWAPMSASC
jgi:poly(3-hydroxybutyrate) depolymerase